MAGKRKRLLPVTTPDADVLRALRNRMEKDIEVLGRYPIRKEDEKKYPVEDLRKGVEWLTWLENEKRNEEKRLARQTLSEVQMS